MPKKIKQKISQKVIQKVIVKVGEMKKKRKARRRAKRQAKEGEGVSSFRQGTTIPPNVTYVTQPTQFTPYMPKEFEEAYRIAKDMYAKKPIEQEGFMDLRAVAQPLKRPTKEVLEDKEIVTPVVQPKPNKKIDVSNPSPDVIFSDPIKDRPLDYKIPELNVFPQTVKEAREEEDMYLRIIPKIKKPERTYSRFENIRDVSSITEEEPGKTFEVEEVTFKKDKEYYRKRYRELFGVEAKTRFTKQDLKKAIERNEPL